MIDLLAGQVVRAVRGQRSRYQPVVSALCHSSVPGRVAPVLLDCTGSNILYVADLDALQGGAVQIEVLAELLEQEARLELWLDAGFADAAAYTELARRLGTLAARVTPVFGSESLAGRDCARAALAERERSILSLDRRDGEALDRAGCWQAPELWPARLIVMTLERVGALSGPDVATVAAIKRRALQIEVIGAGGIASAHDLALAAESGASAWLTASALHDRLIAPAALRGQ